MRGWAFKPLRAKQDLPKKSNMAIGKKWLEKRDYIGVISRCRTLKKKDRKTREDIAIEHFGDDSAKALRDTHILLRTAYYIILNDQGKIFGPVKCKLRQCANPNCGIELEPWGPDNGGLQKCPQCKSTQWRISSVATYWYVTTKEREQWGVIKRFGVNAEGNLRRIFGGYEYPNVRQNLIKCLGAPVRDMLDYPSLKEAAGELMAPLITCPNCQAQFHANGAKFCTCCGAKLPRETK